MSALAFGWAGLACGRDSVPDAQAPDASTIAAIDGSTPADAALDEPREDAAAGDASGPSALNVLFIGNSYTFFNDLPQMTAALVMGAGRAITVDSVTAGGATLEVLWNAGDARKKIEGGAFTHVVLQGQSIEACGDPATYRHFAEQFASVARQKGAATLLYGTWPRDYGDPVYTGIWPTWDPDDLEACLDASFVATAIATGSTLVDVGRTWMTLHHLNPSLPLYQSDHSHPLPEGTFLAACKFFEALVGTAPVGLPHPPGVTDDEATFIESNIDDPPFDAGIKDGSTDG